MKDFALRPMAEDENFRLLFEDPRSPVAMAIAALQVDINRETTTGDDLAKKRARLNGMRAVREIVVQAHEAHIQAEREVLAKQADQQNRSHMGLPWLRRTFSPTRIGNPLGRLGGTRQES